MLFSSRRPDDADVIRARLRALLDEGAARRGWLPDDDPVDDGTTDPWAEGGTGDTWTLDVPERPAPPDGPSPDGGPPDGGTPDGAPGAGGRHRAAGPATRVAPAPRSARTLWVVAVVAAVAVAGWSWLDRPEVSPVTAGVAGTTAVPAAGTGDPPTTTTPPQEQEVVVDVVGLVAAPGLVTLPAGSRVADAVAAAGGLLPEADPAAVNGAALLVDGQQVAVGVPGAVGGGAPAEEPGGPGTGLVDLNTASVAELDGLPGIGPVLAQRIVDHRTEQGPFAGVEQLDDIRGIGPALYAEIAPLVTV